MQSPSIAVYNISLHLEVMANPRLDRMLLLGKLEKLTLAESLEL